MLSSKVANYFVLNMFCMILLMGSSFYHSGTLAAGDHGEEIFLPNIRALGPALADGARAAGTCIHQNVITPVSNIGDSSLRYVTNRAFSYGAIAKDLAFKAKAYVQEGAFQTSGYAQATFCLARNPNAHRNINLAITAGAVIATAGALSAGSLAVAGGSLFVMQQSLRQIRRNAGHTNFLNYWHAASMLAIQIPFGVARTALNVESNSLSRALYATPIMTSVAVTGAELLGSRIDSYIVSPGWSPLVGGNVNMLVDFLIVNPLIIDPADSMFNTWVNDGGNYIAAGLNGGLLSYAFHAPIMAQQSLTSWHQGDDPTTAHHRLQDFSRYGGVVALIIVAGATGGTIVNSFF